MRLTPTNQALPRFNFANARAEASSLYYLDGDTLRFRFHKYQKLAMKASDRFLLVLGGSQSGKTVLGSIWLHREVLIRGPGDYLAVAPTYQLMKKKMLPEFLRLFSDMLKLGTYNKTDKTFTVSELGEISLFGKRQKTQTVIFFGHAQDADSLESATAKAAWLDECGQKKFKLESFEAVLRRLSLFQGRILMTTTPYYLGWLKQKFWDVWESGQAAEASVRVIVFASIANPSFPREEYERARRDLPRWKFDMFYNARFTQPAGMIYDCVKEDVHKVRRFAIPDRWKRYAGFDFGGVNTAVVLFAEEPTTGRLYAYREYKAGGRTAVQHVEKLLAGEKVVPLAAGGSKSEGQWRDEFRAAGLHIVEPGISDVEVGINRVYGGFQRNEIFIFDDLGGVWDELMSYSRQLDDNGEPTEGIEDKSSYHFLDAIRYIISYVKTESAGWRDVADLGEVTEFGNRWA